MDGAGARRPLGTGVAAGHDGGERSVRRYIHAARAGCALLPRDQRATVLDERPTRRREDRQSHFLSLSGTGTPMRRLSRSLLMAAAVPMLTTTPVPTHP